MQSLTLGIDIGSTTAKAVVLEGDSILFQIYERHLSQVRQKTLEILEQAAPFLQGRSFTAAISGSAGLGMAEAAGIPFVQEVYATGEVVRRLAPDTGTVIELGGEDAKVIFFKGGVDERMNGSCAGGMYKHSFSGRIGNAMGRTFHNVRMIPVRRADRLARLAQQMKPSVLRLCCQPAGQVDRSPF